VARTRGIRGSLMHPDVAPTSGITLAGAKPQTQMVRRMILRIATAVAGALCIFSTLGFAAGFDCAKANSAVEKLICSDNALSKADEELSNIYSQALASSATPPEFKKEQINWIRAKRDTCRNRECIAEAYKKRIEVLSGPAPVEEYYLRDRFSIGGPPAGDDDDPDEARNTNGEKQSDDEKPGALYYTVCVKVHGNPSAPLIDFEIYFPDSRQSVSGEYVRCKAKADGTLEFAFTDNWGNRGRGKLDRSEESATLSLEEVEPLEEPGWGRNALRNYGDYDLTKQKCESGEDR